jgi:hypothetical protein
MHRHSAGIRSFLRKLKLKDLVTFANLAKTVIDIVRALTGND